MKYSYDFQYLPKGAVRPSDDGVVVPVQTDDAGFLLAPNVGDYVQMIQMADTEGNAQFAGRVKSRLFTYMGAQHCSVNIVIEEVDDAIWGSLIKE